MTYLAAIHTALACYRRHLVTRTIINRLILSTSIALCAMVVCAGVFALVPWTVLPLIWDGVILCWIGAVIVIFVQCLVLNPMQPVDVARRVEHSTGAEHPLLSIAVQLAGSSRSDESTILVQSVLKNAAESITGYPARVVPPLSRRKVFILAGAAVLCTLSLLPRQGIASYWLLPLAMVARQDAVVTPGSVYVARNAGVVLRLAPRKGVYPVCGLQLISPDGQVRMPVSIRPDSSGVFSHVMDSLRQTVIYRFSMNGRALPADTITVVAPPSLRTLSLRLDPPAYTGWKPSLLPDGQGSVTAFAGTGVHIHATASFALARAWIIFNGRDSLELSVSGDSINGMFTVRENGSYTFGMIDSLGQVNDSLSAFFIDLLLDEPPLVHFLLPAVNKVLRPEQVETLLVESADDLGITQVGVQWRCSGDDSVSLRILPSASGDKTVQASLRWDLSGLRLYPQDTVFYWAYAIDNRQSGLQRTVSDTFWLRLPGLEEIHRAVSQKSDDARDAMSSVREGQKDLGEKLEELARSAQQGKELSWEQKKVLSDVQQQVQSQQDSLGKAVKDLQEAVQTMREQGMADEQLLRKMDEVRKAIEELVKQYGDSLLFEKDRTQPELSIADMKEAVDKMKEALPELEKQLDIALKYLDAMRKDQQRSALADRADKLVERQREVSQLKDTAVQLKRQQELAASMETLRRDVDRTSQPGDADRLFDKSAMPSFEEFDSLSRMMQSQCSSGQPPSQKQMQKAGMSMMSMADQMRSQMSSAMMQKMQQEQAKLLDMTRDALSLADWQREVTLQSQTPQSAAGNIRQQQALQQAARAAAEKLDSLSMVPPQSLQDIMAQFDNADRAMEQALKAMDGAAPQKAMGAASAGLTGAAQALLSAGEAMSGPSGASGSGGEGMSGSMRKLSGKQAAINSATADLLRQMMQQGQSGSGGGDGGSSQSGARTQAQEAQNALANQLKELAEKYGKDGSGSAGDGARMKELEEEARKLAQMLEHPQEQLRDRQDQFLSRMLQSALSVHREEEGKEERTSATAGTVFTPAGDIPAAGPVSAADTFYKMRRRALEGNIPVQYRGAVRAYFDSLGMVFLKGDGKN